MPWARGVRLGVHGGRSALHVWTGKAGPMLFEGWVTRDTARTRPWDDL